MHYLLEWIKVFLDSRKRKHHTYAEKTFQTFLSTTYISIVKCVPFLPKMIEIA